MLDSEGPLIGAVEGLEFEAGEVAVPAGSRLFIYSDGAFEIVRSDGSMWPFAEFVAKLAREDGAAATSPPAGRMDALLDHIRQPPVPLERMLRLVSY